MPDNTDLDVLFGSWIRACLVPGSQLVIARREGGPPTDEQEEYCVEIRRSDGWAYQAQADTLAQAINDAVFDKHPSRWKEGAPSTPAKDTKRGGNG